MKGACFPKIEVPNVTQMKFTDASISQKACFSHKIKQTGLRSNQRAARTLRYADILILRSNNLETMLCCHVGKRVLSSPPRAYFFLSLETCLAYISITEFLSHSVTFLIFKTYYAVFLWREDSQGSEQIELTFVIFTSLVHCLFPSTLVSCMSTSDSGTDGQNRELDGQDHLKNC